MMQNLVIHDIQFRCIINNTLIVEKKPKSFLESDLRIVKAVSVLACYYR